MGEASPSSEAAVVLGTQGPWEVVRVWAAAGAGFVAQERSIKPYVVVAVAPASVATVVAGLGLAPLPCPTPKRMKPPIQQNGADGTVSGGAGCSHVFCLHESDCWLVACRRLMLRGHLRANSLQEHWIDSRMTCLCPLPRQLMSPTMQSTSWF